MRVALNVDWARHYVTYDIGAIQAPIAALIYEKFGDLPGLGFPPSQDRVSMPGSNRDFGAVPVLDKDALSTAVANKTEGKRSSKRWKEHNINPKFLYEVMGNKKDFLTPYQYSTLQSFFDGHVPGVDREAVAS